MVFSEKIKAKIDNLSVVEGLLERLYNEGNISEEIYGNILVAVTEGILNAVNHGSKGDETKDVQFTINLGDKEIEVVIEDSGNGFDVDALPDPTDPANIEKGSGRGIFIMKNLSDDIAFENEGARVVMKFDRDVKVTMGA